MSHRKVNASTIEYACGEWLKARDKRIEQEREALIEKKLNSWWGRFWRIDRAEAIRLCKNESGWRFVNPWQRAEWNGAFEAADVKRLQNVCKLKLADDTIEVDVDMLNTLKNFL
jgi:hypothetical protein